MKTQLIAPKKQFTITTIFQFIFSRTIVFYVILFLFSGQIIRYEMIRAGLKARLLNHLMPGSYASLLDLEKNGVLEERQFTVYYRFYEELLDVYPQKSEVLGMMGFLTYHLGEKARAANYYREAVKIKPDVFHFQYNLGLIQYAAGEDDLAAEALQQAIRLTPNSSINFIRSAKIVYWPIIKESKMNYDDLIGRLRVGYRNVYVLLIKLYEKNKDYRGMYEYSQHALNSDVRSQEVFYYFAAIASWNLGEKEKAIEHLKSSIKLNASFYEAQVALEQFARQLNVNDLASEAGKVIASFQRKGSKPFFLKDLQIKIVIF
jgi:predicted Zn-dependent protease